MISDRESKILRSRSSALLNNEVLALHQRLGRCRKAIYAIEVEISKAKKSHKN
jgi:primosomal replication protein N''